MKWTNRGHQLDHVKSIYGEKTKYIFMEQESMELICIIESIGLEI